MYRKVGLIGGAKGVQVVPPWDLGGPGGGRIYPQKFCPFHLKKVAGNDQKQPALAWGHLWVATAWVLSCHYGHPRLLTDPLKIICHCLENYGTVRFVPCRNATQKWLHAAHALSVLSLKLLMPRSVCFTTQKYTQKPLETHWNLVHISIQATFKCGVTFDNTHPVRAILQIKVINSLKLSDWKDAHKSHRLERCTRNKSGQRFGYWDCTSTAGVTTHMHKTRGDKIFLTAMICWQKLLCYSAAHSEHRDKTKTNGTCQRNG